MLIRHVVFTLWLHHTSANLYSNPNNPEVCSATGQDCGCSSLKRDSSHTARVKPDTEQGKRSNQDHVDNMIVIKGGNFKMGTDNPFIKLDREGPARSVYVSDFYLDKYEVTNAQFEKFVKETKHKTEAEIYGDSFVLEGMLSAAEDAKVVNVVAAAPWWLPVKGATWDHPEGSDTTLTGRMSHPVVHVSWNDANAYCRWAGKRLPTEAEFEKACQGGSEALYPWGNELLVEGRHQANIWQGTFPKQNTEEDGYKTTSPIGQYPANGYGAHDLIGNVWEWVDDWWTTEVQPDKQRDPKGPPRGTEKVKKGGSFMCHKSYCYRYRCPARTKTSADTTGMNVGFRCAKSDS